jgi:zinc protease
MINTVEAGTKVTKKIGSVEAKKQKDVEYKKQKLFNAKSKTLKNGLQIIVVEDHDIPRISVGVLYRVGSCDDPANLFGLSHMTEHMFFHGSKKYPSIDKALGNVGGGVNACTSSDFTLYTTDCPSSALHLVLDIEADRMRDFNLEDEDIFNKEKMAVTEERLMRVENSPLGLASEYIDASLSPQHPYGKEIIGSMKNIDAYSMNAVNEHYRKWYAPNNACIVIIGDVDHQAVFHLADQYFGNIPAGQAPKREREKNSIDSDIVHKITYQSDKVTTAKVDLLYNAPHHTTFSQKELFALDIGLCALFNGVAYDFYRYLADKKSLISGINYSCGPSLNPAPLRISVELMPDVPSKRFLKTFFDGMQKVITKGLSSREFNRAKRSCLTSATYATCDSHRKIRMVFVQLAMGYTIEQIESTIDDINSVTIDDVNKMLNTVFGQKPIGIAKVLPKTRKQVQSS